MAQRTEKEETEFKSVPETTLTLHVNNATSSKTTSLSSSQRRSGSVRSPTARSTLTDESVVDRTVTVVVVTEEQEEEKPKAKVVNRCSGCRKRVGITGFRCRCGDLFCGEHRYSDRHDCSYDYKSVGKEAIARENPVVKAAKIVRI